MKISEELQVKRDLYIRIQDALGNQSPLAGSALTEQGFHTRVVRKLKKGRKRLFLDLDNPINQYNYPLFASKLGLDYRVEGETTGSAFIRVELGKIRADPKMIFLSEKPPLLENVERGSMEEVELFNELFFRDNKFDNFKPRDWLNWMLKDRERVSSETTFHLMKLIILYDARELSIIRFLSAVKREGLLPPIKHDLYEHLGQQEVKPEMFNRIGSDEIIAAFA